MTISVDPETWGGTLDFNGNGVAGCCRCGWRGAPPLVDGVRSTFCPACESPETEPPRIRVAEPPTVVDGKWAEMDPGTLYRGRIAELRRRARARVTRDPKVGRNDPCTCGSKRKYKRCCGAPARA